MIKLIFLMRRKPGMTRAECQRYWLQEHAPLVKAKAAGPFGVRRYVQVHTAYDEVNERMAKLRGMEEAYDGLAEVWYDSMEQFRAGHATPEGQAATQMLMEDEPNFLDLPGCRAWLGEEHVIIHE